MVPVQKPSLTTEKTAQIKTVKMSITLEEFGLYIKNKVNKSMAGLDDFLLLILFITHMHQLHRCCCCELHIFIQKVSLFRLNLFL